MPARCLHPARGLDRARSPHPRVCGASAAPARTETNFGLRESTRGSTVTEQSTTGLPALPRLPMRLCAADSPRNSPLHFELFFFSSLWLRGGPFLGPRLSERRLLSRLLPPEGPPPQPPLGSPHVRHQTSLKGDINPSFLGVSLRFSVSLSLVLMTGRGARRRPRRGALQPRSKRWRESLAAPFLVICAQDLLVFVGVNLVFSSSSSSSSLSASVW